ncbi:hypothetical protein FOA52_007694 [Chlamydomonas sp. UWO 241]|nr:hypothetical protein FOA52_007694 [Chlamydomonas sp. UWO 241]
MQMSRGQASRLVAAAAGTCVVGTIAHSAWKRHHSTDPMQAKRIKLPRPLVDAISGAVGEFGQILLLYPVETIKVRCQTDGLAASQVVSHMWRQAAQPGGASLVLKQLYSGIGATAVFSIAVGAVHWLSFCAAKRTAISMLDARAKEKQAATAAAAAAAAASSARCASGAGASTSSGGDPHHLHHLHVSSSHHMHDSDVYTDGEPDHATGAKGQQQQQGAAAAEAGSSSTRGSSGGKSRRKRGEKRDRDAGGISPPEASSGSSAGPNAPAFSTLVTANMIAAAVGAFSTAIVESPVELFRHQAQAGIISGNLMREMGNSVRRNGPGALWFGFLPFLLEAFPYDMSELGTYSQLRDLHTESCKPGSRFSSVVDRLPSQAWDAGIGATAGAAAVMLSMPSDTVKTYLQTHTAGQLALSPAAQVAQFFATGRQMVARGGVQALYLGVVPRLLQQVPSSTICWYSVEACQRFLAPYTDDGGEAPKPGGGGH